MERIVALLFLLLLFVAAQAASMQSKKSRAYLYQFTRIPNIPIAEKLAAFHSLEYHYVFGHLNQIQVSDEKNAALSSTIMDYWTAIAWTGDRNGPGRLNWPAYDRRNDMNLEFADPIWVNQHLFKKERDGIEQISKKLDEQSEPGWEDIRSLWVITGLNYRAGSLRTASHACHKSLRT